MVSSMRSRRAHPVGRAGQGRTWRWLALALSEASTLVKDVSRRSQGPRWTGRLSTKYSKSTCVPCYRNCWQVCDVGANCKNPRRVKRLDRPAPNWCLSQCGRAQVADETRGTVGSPYRGIRVTRIGCAGSRSVSGSAEQGKGMSMSTCGQGGKRSLLVPRSEKSSTRHRVSLIRPARDRPCLELQRQNHRRACLSKEMSLVRRVGGFRCGKRRIERVNVDQQRLHSPLISVYWTVRSTELVTMLQRSVPLGDERMTDDVDREECTSARA